MKWLRRVSADSPYYEYDPDVAPLTRRCGFGHKKTVPAGTGTAQSREIGNTEVDSLFLSGVP